MFLPTSTQWKLATSLSLLVIESNIVIWSRLMQIASGRGTKTENLLMVTEKVAAVQEAALTLATGGSAGKAVGGVRRRVRANARRLARG